MIGQSWTLDLAAPIARTRSKKTGVVRTGPAWLTMNDRLHWRSVDRRKSDWRDATRRGAELAGLPMGRASIARVEAQLRFRRTVRRDPINWHPTVKPCLDELVTLGFLPDDSPAYLHCQDCPHLRLGQLLDRDDPAHGRLVLVVTVLDLLEAAP